MKKTQQGFGIIGLIVAVGIMVLLSTVFLNRQKVTSADGKTGLKTIEKSKDIADKTKVRGLGMAISNFKMAKNRNPKDLEELVRAGYASGGNIRDRNGKIFRYEDGKVYENK